MTRPRRFLPPITGGAQTTGWEALDKWVGDGGGSGATNGSATAEPTAVSAGGTSSTPDSAGGLLGFLKRLFGGK